MQKKIKTLDKYRGMITKTQAKAAIKFLKTL